MMLFESKNSVNFLIIQNYIIIPLTPNIFGINHAICYFYDIIDMSMYKRALIKIST